MGRYVRPERIGEAVELLAGGRFTLLAGGTDFYPVRVGRAITEDVLDLTALVELRGITEATDHWRIGALTTWSEVIATDLPPLFDGLKQAAREVGGRQIQNSGTLGGNLANASPAADGAPVLLALDARLELTSKAGRRQLAVGGFLRGNRQTALSPGEIITAVLVPKPARAARSVFIKLGARRYLVISIAMVAVVIETASDGRVTAARVAVGSCSAVAQRLPRLEQDLLGLPGDRLAAAVKPGHLTGLMPISDVRASAEYRGAAAVTLVTRALEAFA